MVKSKRAKLRQKIWKEFKRHYIEDNGDSCNLSIKDIWCNGFNTGWNKRFKNG